jgi:hypothetical protein
MGYSNTGAYGYGETALTPISGIVRNGKIEIEAPADSTEGAEVRIWFDKTHGDDDGPMSPNEIERTLEAMSHVQPFILSDTERLEWQISQDEQKALDIASAESRARKLMSHWG